MDLMRAVILLAHPIFALLLLWWIIKQHSWKKIGKNLNGEERAQALDSHEIWGRRIFPGLIIVISIAFLANAWRGYSESGSFTEYLFPSSFHGLTGLFGAVLLYITWNYGRSVVAKRESGESWALTKTKHGRAADLIVILGCIHAFIGFLHIFNVL